MLIEIEGLLYGKMINIQCEDEHACVFIQMSLKEFEIIHKQGCPENCKFSSGTERFKCKIKNVGAK